jgi:type IV secretory pathway TrbF-like protein
MSLKFLSRYFLILTCVTALSGCGVREDYVTAKVEKMQTWQICKRLLENKPLSFQIAWYNQVLQKRGEIGTTKFFKNVERTVKDLSESSPLQ